MHAVVHEGGCFAARPVGQGQDSLLLQVLQQAPHTRGQAWQQQQEVRQLRPVPSRGAACTAKRSKQRKLTVLAAYCIEVQPTTSGGELGPACPLMFDGQ